MTRFLLSEVIHSLKYIIMVCSKHLPLQNAPTCLAENHVEKELQINQVICTDVVLSKEASHYLIQSFRRIRTPNGIIRLLWARHFKTKILMQIRLISFLLMSCPDDHHHPSFNYIRFVIHGCGYVIQWTFDNLVPEPSLSSPLHVTSSDTNPIPSIPW